MTKTENRSFGDHVARFLLFSTMQNPAEAYLSREMKANKPSGVRSLKDNISKSLDNKVRTLFGKKVSNNSLDSEIETAIHGAKAPQENVNFLEKMKDYNNDLKKPADIVKSALKNLYQTFMSYAKTTYGKVKEVINYGKRKIIQGPVRMTTEKFARLGQYINAALTPSWNMPTGSKMDLDTLSVQIANHISIDEEGIKQNPAYGALVYQSSD
jgi:hypothetical protein